VAVVEAAALPKAFAHQISRFRKNPEPAYVYPTIKYPPVKWPIPIYS